MLSSQTVLTMQLLPATGSPPNEELRSQLASDINKLGESKDKLQAARHHMVAEGRLLAANLGHDFTSAQNLLETDLKRPKHEWLDFSKLENELTAKLEQRRTTTSDDLRQLYNELVSQMVDKMTAYDHLYKEVLALDLNASERSNVESAQKAFGQMADGLYKNLEKWIEDSIDRQGKHLQGQIEKLEEDLKIPSSFDAKDLPAMQGKLNSLKNIKNEFEGVVSGEEAERNKESKSKQIGKDKAIWKNGLASIRRDVFVDELKEKGLSLSKWQELSRVFVGAGLPQFIASLLHFGYIRNATDDALSDQNFAARTAGTGAALGASHKLVTDTVRAWTQLAMDNTIGLNVAPVSALEVYPSAVNVVSRNGELHPLTKGEKETINDTQTAERQKFIDAQSGSKFGTLSGDFAGFLSFGTAHALRELAHQLSDLNFQNLHARAVTSAIAGMAMAGGQAVAQATAKHDGIPTHIPTSPSTPFGEQATETWEKMLKSLNLLNKEQRDDLFSKMGGATAGVLLSNALGELAKLLEGKDELAEKMMQEVGEIIHNDLGELSGGQIAERIGLVVITFFQSHAVLYPFFSNNQVKAEVASYNKNKEKADQVDRPEIGIKNIVDPGRKDLPHGTKAEGGLRPAENTYNRFRGAAQVPVQSLIHPGETVGHISTGVAKAGRSLSSAMGHLPGTSGLRQRTGGRTSDGTESRRTEGRGEEHDMPIRNPTPFDEGSRLESGRHAGTSQAERAQPSGSRDT